MQRRSFMARSGRPAPLLAAVVAAPAVAQARPRSAGAFASSFPKSLDTIFGAAEVFAKTVSAATGGKFAGLGVRGAVSSSPAFRSSTRSRTAPSQCGHTAPYYFFGKDETFAFDCADPVRPELAPVRRRVDVSRATA